MDVVAIETVEFTWDVQLHPIVVEPEETEVVVSLSLVPDMGLKACSHIISSRLGLSKLSCPFLSLSNTSGYMFSTFSC